MLPGGGREGRPAAEAQTGKNLALRHACLTQSAKTKILKELTDQHLKITRFHVKIGFPASLRELKFGNLSVLPAW